MQKFGLKKLETSFYNLVWHISIPLTVTTWFTRQANSKRDGQTL